MGEMADYFEEQMWDQMWNVGCYDSEVLRAKHHTPLEPEITLNTEWTTQDGQQIKFRDLDMQHFANICNMLERQRNPHAAEVLRALYNERLAPQRHVEPEPCHEGKPYYPTG